MPGISATSEEEDPGSMPGIRNGATKEEEGGGPGSIPVICILEPIPWLQRAQIKKERQMFDRHDCTFLCKEVDKTKIKKQSDKVELKGNIIGKICPATKDNKE
jgi:hypothetical protein